jgi:hypothetical protein
MLGESRIRTQVQDRQETDMAETEGRGAVQLRRVRLERARDKGQPEPTPGTGYEFVAPLDEGGFINLESWKNYRTLCFVHRLERGAVVERGLLVHRAGGQGGATWAFDYELGEGDEEAGYRFGSHAFKTGEYVSVRDEDGELHTYRVASVMAV